MKRSLRLRRGFCLVVLCTTVALVTAQGQPKTVSIHQLPAAVQKTVKTELGDDKLIEIEKDDEGGEVSYTVTRLVKGAKRFFTVGDDGELQSVEITLEDTPPAVQTTIKGQVGQGTLESIEKSFEDNEISFDVEMKKKDGAERSFSVAADGRLTSVQIGLEE